MSHASCEGLAHQALVYSSPEEFVETLVPFVEDGRRKGDRIFAATTAANIAALRRALGPAAEGIEFEDSGKWYQQPYRTLSAYQRYIDEHANGSAVRVIGEPVWDGRPPVSIEEWARYESVINYALADAPAWIICPYDASTLPAEIVEHAEQTHPELIRGGAAERSAAFVAPEAYAAAFDSRQLSRPPAGATEFWFAGEDYGALRRFARSRAAEAGLAAELSSAVVFSVHELTTNAARHGSLPVRLRTWQDDLGLAFEVEDSGTGLEDNLAGFAMPDPNVGGGRGLWLVRQLCDTLAVARRPGGFVVRARWTL